MAVDRPGEVRMMGGGRILCRLIDLTRLRRKCPCTGRTLAKLVHPAILTILAGGPLHGYRIVEYMAKMPVMEEIVRIQRVSTACCKPWRGRLCGLCLGPVGSRPGKEILSPHNRRQAMPEPMDRDP